MCREWASVTMSGKLSPVGTHPARVLCRYALHICHICQSVHVSLRVLLRRNWARGVLTPHAENRRRTGHSPARRVFVSRGRPALPVAWRCSWKNVRNNHLRQRRDSQDTEGNTWSLRTLILLCFLTIKMGCFNL